MDHTYKSILKMFNFLEEKRKNQFILVIILSFFASFLEVATLGILVPFINIILDPTMLDSGNKIITSIKDIFNIQTQNQFIIFFSIGFIIFSLFSGLFRIFLLSFMIRLSNLSSADIGVEI